MAAGWSNQKPFVVTEALANMNWGGRRGEKARDMLSCAFCMSRLEIGDKARWVCMSRSPNIFVCAEHDGPDVVERWTERWLTVIKPILDRWGSD